MIRQPGPPLHIVLPSPRPLRRRCREVDARSGPAAEARRSCIVYGGRAPTRQEFAPGGHNLRLSFSRLRELQVGVARSKQRHAVVRHDSSKQGANALMLAKVETDQPNPPPIDVGLYFERAA